MDNKKIFLSFILFILIAISVSAVSAVDADNATLAEDAIPTDADVVQTKVNNANSGDTITLEDKTYDFANQTVTIDGRDKITIRGTGNTIIKGHGGQNSKTGALFIVSESIGVTFKDITFIDTNPNNNFTYDGNVEGYGITFDGSGAENGVVDNCSFADFNTAVNVKSCNYVTVKNSKFSGGYATKLINDPTVNKEKGSKVVSAGGSLFLSVLNCTFDGPMLDAVSIYGGSGDAKIIGNTFKDNVYAIFFGGASTEGTFINDNTFIECGQFVKDANTTWGGYPVISIEKASDSVYMNNNTFYAVNNNKLIAAESANTAHGAPSTLGDINITNSNVNLANDNVVAGSVTFLHILSRTGDINPKAPITLTGNKYAKGVKAVVVWYNDWGVEDSENIVIPQAPEPTPAPVAVSTSISSANLAIYAGNSGKIKLTLKDANGVAVANKTVNIVIDGVAKTVTTDDNGIAILSVKYSNSGTHYATLAFTGDNDYTGSIKTVKISVLKKVTALTITKKTFKVKTKNKKVTTVLKSGKTVLKYKKVTLKVKGKTYTAKTNSKGIATFNIKIAKKGTFKALTKFAGDGAYKAASKYSYVYVR
ncbi:MULTISPECIES: Ig-like domain-containing protein [Methanobrevibacter]|uniref:Uncharacterized protein n=1 Tax=Methanobrevibacter gottschalkii DSM 11977 TaxID=1122229 RepID=A0A3N5B5E6_9EURY|nr:MULTISPECIES: Ig-like domain-containing protein [Methanobrevibacter]OEC94348.1 hypothetical protein A9505_08780 [Methanobrevibacter sp. A27]RPF50780.1 hypothetical protein EDC42_1435 [Methanobrevibacter gottschalkii DSM 11977]